MCISHTTLNESVAVNFPIVSLSVDFSTSKRHNDSQCNFPLRETALQFDIRAFVFFFTEDN